MIIKFLISLFFVVFVTQIGCSLALDLPVAKVTVKVVDELFNPIENAEVTVGFQEADGRQQGIKDTAERGLTGNDGVFSASRRTLGHIAYSAKKQGYYKSYEEYHFSHRENGRWQPWDKEFKVVLRKIENPRPMYAREFRAEIPVTDKKVGFDLIEYDWVAPYGRGIHSDLLFKLTKDVKSRDEFDSTLTVSFSKKFDGIQLLKDDRKSGSEFKLPRFAPEDGYRGDAVFTRRSQIGKSAEASYSKDNNYIFRTRSEERNGKLLRAMYGKIQGDISFEPTSSATAMIVFSYYFNPDYTRNLEFDVDHNLFTNLNSLERIGLD